jgi:3-oxoadipate enol-lactonase/4-carboxymuconolactone decarboxylase
MSAPTTTPLYRHVRGTGPAVLWLHGYTMDSTCWDALWDRLPGWRHVGVDLPGHGRSGPMRPGWTLADLAAQLTEVLRAERADRVVALSFGSCVALQLAIDEPGLVRKLVLGAPTIAGAPDQPGTARRYKELMMLRRLGAAPGDLTDRWMQSPPDIFRGTEAHPELRARLRQTISRHRWSELDSGAMRSIGAAVHTDGQLRRIAAKTLVVTGSEDMPTFLDNAERLRRTVADVQVLSLAGAGHLVLIERPDEVAGALAAHLTQQT